MYQSYAYLTRKKDIKKNERIYRAATKMVPCLINIPYEGEMIKSESPDSR